MYRHLLVPIDETYLSTVMIGNAVEFAQVLGARITFFHAQVKYSASFFGGGEVVHLDAPDPLSYQDQGRALELLTKAESAARARGVPCSVSHAVSETPHAAILSAAQEAGCDLIYMASHGRRTNLGMLLGSQTLKVLMESEIPVLVSATKNPPAPERAIGIIRDEHRSLAAVVRAWLHLLQKSIRSGTLPDPVLQDAIVMYIRTFPLAVHHPKEEEYLFKRLRERTNAVTAELDELGLQHARDHALVDELAVLVAQVATGKTTPPELEQAVLRYAKFIWEHMGREEGVILPAAQRYLNESDWEEINAAFSQNQDPRFHGKTDAEYKLLFSHIVNVVGTSKTD